MRDLERYGNGPGSSFFLVRKAQSELSVRKYYDAIATSNRAISQTPNLLSAYFIRAEAKIGLNDIIGGEHDISGINELLQKAGGFSEGDEARLHDLQVRILIEKRLFRQAKEKVSSSPWLPRKVALRLLGLIEKAIAYDSTGVDDDLRQWALKRGAKRR